MISQSVVRGGMIFRPECHNMRMDYKSLQNTPPFAL
jgi:hypothetical protein